MYFGAKLSDDHKGQRQLGARRALIVLSLINLLNFADRYVLSSVKSLVKKDLMLTDTQTALPATCMILVFMVCAVIFGFLADKQFLDRRTILFAAVIFWSAATAIAGAAKTFGQLLLFRALIGVGEAAYMTIVPPMLADFYPLCDRNMVFTVFYLCSPLGGALGFVVGSVVGGALGWRIAFLVCGVPGVALALFIPTLNDPARGVNDSGEKVEKKANGSILQDIVDILRQPHYIAAVIGMIASSFVVGGLSDWFSTLILRTYTKTKLGQVGMVLGACTMLGGIGGTLLGSKTVSLVQNGVKNAYFLVPAFFMVPAAALLFVAVNVKHNLLVTYVALLVSWICFFSYSSPINVALINCMPVHLRSRSQGLAIFLCHVLGDIISPPIIGAISDASGSLRSGMQLVWIGSLVSTLSWGIGGSCLGALDVEQSGEKGSSSLFSLFAGGSEAGGQTKKLVDGAAKSYASTEESYVKLA